MRRVQQLILNEHERLVAEADAETGSNDRCEFCAMRRSGPCLYTTGSIRFPQDARVPSCRRHASVVFAAGLRLVGDR